jgi:hypothetical protein
VLVREDTNQGRGVSEYILVKNTNMGERILAYILAIVLKKRDLLKRHCQGILDSSKRGQKSCYQNTKEFYKSLGLVRGETNQDGGIDKITKRLKQ